MKRWKITRGSFWLRFVLGGALALIAPAVGAALMSIGAGIPIVLFGDAIGSAEAGVVVALLVLGAMWLVGALVTWRVWARAMRWVGKDRAAWGEIAIGADGARTGGVIRPRVLRWSDVKRVSLTDGHEPHVVAHLADGDTVQWHVADASGLFDAASAALERFRQTRSATAPAELVAPATEVGAWMERVRGLLVAGDYREQALSPEVLLRVAQDPTAPAAARVGSALALSRAEEPVRARVRVAIEETADPEVADLMTEALAGTVSPRRIVRVSTRG